MMMIDMMMIDDHDMRTICMTIVGITIVMPIGCGAVMPATNPPKCTAAPRARRQAGGGVVPQCTSHACLTFTYD